MGMIKKMEVTISSGSEEGLLLQSIPSFSANHRYASGYMMWGITSLAV